MAGRLASSVLTSASTWAEAPAVTVIETCGGVHDAEARALALQFAWQFASTMQPPCRVPPLHVSGVAMPEHEPEHWTEAPAMAEQLASHWPLQLPLHETFAIGARVHLPEHEPWHVPSA